MLNSNKNSLYIKIINDENQSKRPVLVLMLKKENLNLLLNAEISVSLFFIKFRLQAKKTLSLFHVCLT